MDSNDPQYINLHHAPIKVEDTAEDEQNPAAIAVVHDDDSAVASTVGSIDSYIALDHLNKNVQVWSTFTDAHSNSGTYHTKQSGI